MAEIGADPSMAIRKLKTRGFGSGSPAGALVPSLRLGHDLGQGSMLKKGGSTSRPTSKTRKGVNVKAKIQDMTGGQMSKPRYKTWKGVIVKTDIQDKDGAVKGGQHQCQSQDP